MIYYLISIIINSCCFGKEQKKLIDKVKDDVKELTKEEIQLLTKYMTKPLRDKTYCC